MHLVHDHMGHTEQLCISPHAAQQNACGAEQQARISCGGCVKPYMVANMTAWLARRRHAALICHPVCHADGCYASWLCTDNVAGCSRPTVQTVFQDILGYLQENVRSRLHLMHRNGLHASTTAKLHRCDLSIETLLLIRLCTYSQAGSRL